MILSNRGNLLVHLAPAAVVARVATLTARTRRAPAEWLAREVAVAGYVASRRGPAVAPADDAGPHWQDGFAISLWEYVVAVDSVVWSLCMAHLYPRRVTARWRTGCWRAF